MLKQLPNRVNRPAWWQMLQWIIDPIAFQQRWAKKYGDLFTISLWNDDDNIVVISNPSIIQEIFNQDPKQFDIGRGNQIVAPLVGQNSLLLLDGDRHKRERKLLMPSFHGERLQTYAQQICEITEEVANQWQEGQPLIARTIMQDITLEVIIQVVFGLRKGERYQKIKPLLAAMLNMTDSPLSSSILFLQFLQKDLGSWSPWGKLKHRQQEVRGLLQAEIEERRNKNEAGKDILSLMQAARDENGEALSDLELKDELMTLLFAGHETTATMLAWAFYEIHKSPEVREKILQELDSLGENPNPMQIAQLSYLSAVCQETLRMYPVIPVIFPRITKTPMKIGGYNFDTEIVLMPSIYLVHYREDLYPQPQEFKPERFLERQYSPSEYIPFGGGNRRCLGYALALLEMKLVIGTILSHYQLALVENKPVKIQRRGVTLAPAGGIPLVLQSKRNPQQLSINKSVSLVS